MLQLEGDCFPKGDAAMEDCVGATEVPPMPKPLWSNTTARLGLRYYDRNSVPSHVLYPEFADKLEQDDCRFETQKTNNPSTKKLTSIAGKKSCRIPDFGVKADYIDPNGVLDSLKYSVTCTLFKYYNCQADANGTMACINSKSALCDRVCPGDYSSCEWSTSVANTCPPSDASACVSNCSLDGFAPDFWCKQQIAGM